MMSAIVVLLAMTACEPQYGDPSDPLGLASDFIKGLNGRNGSAVLGLMAPGGRIRASDDSFEISGPLVGEFVDSLDSGPRARVASSIVVGEQVAVSVEAEGETQLLVFETSGNCINTVTYFE